MIRLENINVVGWEAAIRGMRNPMNSWEKSDSIFCHADGECHDITLHSSPSLEEKGTIIVGENDHDLMMRLAKAGSVDAKYRRMLVVYVDITAPLYWWKEFDTYKVGTVANSCSTMHKIHAKEFTLDDFSVEHLTEENKQIFAEHFLSVLNKARDNFLASNDKVWWWQMIHSLPSSYNQKRTIMLNYEVLAGIYPNRRGHKLDEWHDFCSWIETLPYSEIITLSVSNI